jgi:hypothetical protein
MNAMEWVARLEGIIIDSEMTTNH